MKLIDMFEMVLGPSKKMVERRHQEKVMTRVYEADRMERVRMKARLKAIEVSLPAAYHLKQRD